MRLQSGPDPSGTNSNPWKSPCRKLPKNSNTIAIPLLIFSNSELSKLPRAKPCQSGFYKPGVYQQKVLWKRTRRASLHFLKPSISEKTPQFCNGSSFLSCSFTPVITWHHQCILKLFASDIICISSLCPWTVSFHKSIALFLFIGLHITALSLCSFAFSSLG